MLNWLPSLIGLGVSTRSQLDLVVFQLEGSVGANLLGQLHAGAQRRLWVVLAYGGIACSLALIFAADSIFVSAAIACGLAGVFTVGAQLVLSRSHRSTTHARFALRASARPSRSDDSARSSARCMRALSSSAAARAQPCCSAFFPSPSSAGRQPSD
jgi:hypothetical protein